MSCERDVKQFEEGVRGGFSTWLLGRGARPYWIARATAEAATRVELAGVALMRFLGGTAFTIDCV